MKHLLFFLFLIGVNFAFAQSPLPIVHYEGEKCALVDAKFKPLTAYKYVYIENFQEGFALATLHTTTGKRLQTYLNAKGQELILPTENQLFPFVERRAIFKEKDKFGFLDTWGRAIVPAIYKKTHNYSEGLALVIDPQEKKTFIDAAGEIAFEVPEKYGFIDAKCTNGLIRVCMIDKDSPYEYYDRGTEKRKGFYSFLDKAGKVVLDLQQKCPLVVEANPFENGTSIVITKDTSKTRRISNQIKMGVIDKKGDWILPPKNDIVERQGANYLVKEIDERNYRIYFGLHDPAGKELLPCIYKNISLPVDDLRAVEVYELNQNALENVSYEDRFKGVLGVMDTLGNVVIQPKYKDLWFLPNKDILVKTSLPPKNTASDLSEELHPRYKYQMFDLSGKPKGEAATFFAYTVYGENYKVSNRQTLFPLCFDKKWALANVKSKAILTEWVDSIAPFNVVQGRQEIPILKDKKWTFMQQTFDNAYSFGEGTFASVKKGKKWAMMHRVGKETTPYLYDSLMPVLQKKVSEMERDVYENLYRRYQSYEEANRTNYDIEIFHTLHIPTNHFLAYQKNKWGVIDGFGKVLAPFENDSIIDIFYNYLIVKRGDKQGVIDYAGKILVNFKKANIEIINSLAYLHEADKVSLYNLENELLTPEPFDQIQPQTESILQVVKDGQRGWIDTEGKVLFPPIYQSISPTRRDYRLRQSQENPLEFCYLLKKDDKQGLADKDFKVIIPCEYDDVDVHGLQSWKLIMVEKNGKKGAINRQNQVIIPIQYDDLGNVQNKIRAKKEGKFGLLDEAGKLIIPIQYDVFHFLYRSEKILGFKGYTQEVFESTGKLLFSKIWTNMLPKEEYIREEEMWGVKDGKKWGFVKPTGETVIPFIYTEVTPFVSFISGKKYAKVRKGKRWGVIDDEGKEIVPCKYDEIEDLQNWQRSYFTVTRKGKTEKIEIKGQKELDRPKEEPMKAED